MQGKSPPSPSSRSAEGMDDLTAACQFHPIVHIVVEQRDLVSEAFSETCENNKTPNRCQCFNECVSSLCFLILRSPGMAPRSRPSPDPEIAGEPLESQQLPMGPPIPSEAPHGWNLGKGLGGQSSRLCTPRQPLHRILIPPSNIFSRKLYLE